MRPSVFWITFANILLPIGVIIFGVGFFPYKPFLPGLATFHNDDPDITPPFDKVIFMVIDALRSDFVFSNHSAFQYTQGLIEAGFAIPFTAHATSPTITMPRVKAITTGSIPGFLDVILNFAESDTTSTLAHQDNWLAQIRANRGQLVMYGDDTWIKLFPGLFTRSEGTTSFFVSDFTEVDNNVTRHINSELGKDDWNGMILHYLGLDHIGHKAGPQSKFMLPKQAEMDEIVKSIYSAINSKPHLESTLFVLAGDHGMNDAGNHGGSGEGETSPALVLMSPKLKQISPSGMACPTKPFSGDFGYYELVEQSDIAPTFAGLLGFPVPKNNLGVFIPSLLGMWDPKSAVELLMRNARQLLELVKATYPGFADYDGPISDCVETRSEQDELACWWAKSAQSYSEWNRGNVQSEAVIDYLFKFSERCRDIMSVVASNYDLRAMSAGIILLTITFSISLSMLLPLMKASETTIWIFPTLTVLYGGMMFASSFVEEEQHFWYWAASGWAAVLFFKERQIGNKGMSPLIILTLLRVARRWNQTGQKFAGAPDIVHYYFPNHTVILWILIISTYMEAFITMSKHAYRRMGPQAIFLFSFTTAFAAFTFKLSFAEHDAIELIPAWLRPMADSLHEISLVNQARAVFGMLGISVIYTYFFELGDKPFRNNASGAVVFHEFTNIFLLTETRFSNTPLFLIFRIISSVLSSLASLTASEISLTILILQHFSFYALGNANHISSVDLSNSYNGVANYNLPVVALLTFVCNWAGPIFWSSFAPLLLVKKELQDKVAWRRHMLMMSVFHSCAGIFMMAACFFLRTHLFIWTVFSPKYLFSMVWVGTFNTVVNLLWGSAMMWAGRNS